MNCFSIEFGPDKLEIWSHSVYPVICKNLLLPPMLLIIRPRANRMAVRLRTFRRM